MKGCGLASAVRTLTIFPFPGQESESPATTFYWFVPIGAFLGVLLYGVALLCQPLGAPLLSGSLIIGLLAYFTRAFHLDGLCDMVDGFGGGWTKERKLEIMKDSHVGAFGVIALIITLFIKVAAVALLVERGGLITLVYAPLLSRFLVVVQAVCNPYARKEGGTAGRSVVEGRLRHVLVALGWVAGAFFFAPLVIVAAMAGVGVVVTLAIAWNARKQVGGVTGDILGATVELSETAMLVVGAILTLLLF